MAQISGVVIKCFEIGLDIFRRHRYDNSVHTTDGSGSPHGSMNRCFADRLGIVYAWKGGFFIPKIGALPAYETYIGLKRRNDHG